MKKFHKTLIINILRKLKLKHDGSLFEFEIFQKFLIPKTIIFNDTLLRIKI